jgi:pyrrolidone-carboxylate peptidase
MTAWRDWNVVKEMNEEDFGLERETILSRLMAMRFRAVHQALRKNQLTSAAQLMDAIGRAAGEGQQAIELTIPNLSIKIEE